MDAITNALAVATVSLLAAISPGPDFFVVLKNSLMYSRRAGFMTAFGVASALIIHLTYTLVGIGVLLAESPLLYAVVKYTGVAYLFYIGLKSVLSSFKKEGTVSLDYAQASEEISPSKAFLQGFLTNMLNPKCAIFFISLFSQFIDPETPGWMRVEFAAINWTISFGWFLLLSYMVTGKRVQGKINRFKVYIDRVMGSALMLLGLKMLVV